jgi:ABC-type lipoprotein release transport system permease subunit
MLAPSLSSIRSKIRGARALVFHAVTLIVRFLTMVFLLGLSLLPLAALLLVVPAFFPQESVLTDTARPARTRVWGVVRRVLALLTGVALLIGLLAVSVEVVSMLGIKSAYFGRLAVGVFGKDLADRLPPAMIQGWPFVLLLVYLSDLVMLMALGKVPLQYNYRSLRVRWRTTLLTAVAFTVVVGLLTVMMAFVNGVHELTSSSGIPGNVFVLSEGATDELFSNFYGSSDATSKVKTWVADTDVRVEGRAIPLRKPVTVKRVAIVPGKEPVPLCSRETYFTINQEVAARAGEPARRRFVQLRGIEDAQVAARVHNISLLEGDWFGDTGAEVLPEGGTACPVVIGEGVAATLGADVGKPRLKPGDTFTLGDLKMVVKGVMKSEGSTFGSEVWAYHSRVATQFGKAGYTTVVLRVDDDSAERAEIMAAHIRVNFANPRLNARPEPKYYEELGRTNQQMTYLIMVVAVIMAIGGVFGVMNTMFAAIAQRTRDIGVLRVLGFKRWQILVSFLLESLAIGLLGGLLGALIGSLADGYQMTSTVSSGGGGKTVIMKLVVSADVFILSILFTIVMGRVGGLVPALSAMRLGILESLR